MMRHGQAVAARSGPDEERVLSDEGRDQVERVTLAMQRAGFEPSRIWHSPYVRAAQTAAAIAQRFSGAACEAKPSWVPHGRSRAVVDELLDDAPDRLLVVSHLPLLPEVVSALLAVPLPLDFTTASVAHIVLPSARPSRFQGALLGFYRGEALRNWGDPTRSTKEPASDET